MRIVSPFGGNSIETCRDLRDHDCTSAGNRSLNLRYPDRPSGGLWPRSGTITIFGTDRLILNEVGTDGEPVSGRSIWDQIPSEIASIYACGRAHAGAGYWRQYCDVQRDSLRTVK